MCAQGTVSWLYSICLAVNRFPSVESSSNENFSQQGQWIILGNWDTVCTKTNCFKSFKALSTTNKMPFLFIALSCRAEISSILKSQHIKTNFLHGYIEYFVYWVLKYLILHVFALAVLFDLCGLLNPNISGWGGQ